MEIDIVKFTDCIEKPGYLNQDGYLRRMTAFKSKGGLLKMVHRLEWEIVNGPIPKGYEINHLCKNRRCCNLEHLEMLTISEHRAKDNSERYRERALSVIEYMKNNPTETQRAVAIKFDITQSGVSGIVKRNKLKENIC